MPGARLSRSGFCTIMEKLRSDHSFRQLLLSDSPGSALREVSCVPEADASYLAAIRWDAGSVHCRRIDEKLVLCSASAY